MTYLLSLIGAESSIDRSERFLCYYINNAMNIQIIRVINEAKCLFDRVVFSRESILFTALPESYLEIHSPLIDGIGLSRVDCKLLHVNEVPNLSKSFAEIFN